MRAWDDAVGGPGGGPVKPQENVRVKLGGGRTRRPWDQKRVLTFAGQNLHRVV